MAFVCTFGEINKNLDNPLHHGHILEKVTPCCPPFPKNYTTIKNPNKIHFSPISSTISPNKRKLPKLSNYDCNISLLIESVERTLGEVEHLIRHKKAKLDHKFEISEQDTFKPHLENSSKPETLALQDNSTSLLHQYCQNSASKDISKVEAILRKSPNAIRTRMKMSRKIEKMSYSSVSLKNIKQYVRYTLPLNIALSQSSNIEIIQLLADRGDDVLKMKDGPEGSSSLSIALKSKPDSLSIINLLLKAKPSCVSVMDNRFNYPLHIACSVGSPLHVIRTLCMHYPEATTKRNVNGETPLRIAQRNSMCPEDVLNFLERITFQEY